MVLQNTLYGLCRDKSNSDHEFEIKFEVYEVSLHIITSAIDEGI